MGVSRPRVANEAAYSLNLDLLLVGGSPTVPHCRHLNTSHDVASLLDLIANIAIWQIGHTFRGGRVFFTLVKSLGISLCLHASGRVSKPKH